MHFLAHGMGLVSHEAPRLTASGPVPYDAYDATRPLEAGMVISVETTMQHPKRGFIKLEDTVAVTDTGYEIYGEGARGWNRGGAARGGSGIAMLRVSLICKLAVVAVAAVAFTSHARSESAEDFFKGKQMSLIVGYNPGGSYDVYSRLAAQLLPKYLPGNPTIAVKNMPGVASVKAANYLFQQAPKDGLTIGMVGQQLALTQALRDPAVAYEMRKFGWLGRFTPIIEVSLTWHTSPTKTINDAMQRETVMAATSAGATTEIMPSMMNKLAGTRFKIVKGYPGTTGTILAMERGETEGAHATLENLLFGKPQWLQEKTVNVLVQYAQRRHPQFADVRRWSSSARATRTSRCSACSAAPPKSAAR